MSKPPRTSRVANNGEFAVCPQITLLFISGEHIPMKKLTLEAFLTRSKQLPAHLDKDYDYSLVTDLTYYEFRIGILII
jgi:hypothetical protein